MLLRRAEGCMAVVDVDPRGIVRLSVRRVATVVNALEFMFKILSN